MDYPDSTNMTRFSARGGYSASSGSARAEPMVWYYGWTRIPTL